MRDNSVHLLINIQLAEIQSRLRMCVLYNYLFILLSSMHGLDSRSREKIFHAFYYHVCMASVKRKDFTFMIIVSCQTNRTVDLLKLCFYFSICFTYNDVYFKLNQVLQFKVNMCDIYA